jgi:hypothetical protein
MDPSVNVEGEGLRVIGDKTASEASDLKTVFEADDKSNKRPKDSRKRDANKDSSDIEGYNGPWAKYENEELVSHPPEEDKGYLDEYMAKMKRRSKKQVGDCSVFKFYYCVCGHNRSLVPILIMLVPILGGRETGRRKVSAAHQGRLRLPRPVVPAHPAGRWYQPQVGLTARKVLHPETPDSRVEGPHEGRLRHQVVPQVCAPHYIGLARQQGQAGKCLLGCLNIPKRHNFLHI